MILCLVVEFADVFGDNTVAPDAIAMIGELRRLQRALAESTGNQQLTIAFADFGSPSATRIFDDFVAATGDEGTLRRVSQGATGAELCGEPAARTILLVRRAEPKLADATTWTIGDLDVGLASLADVERRIRETMHVAIPRPIDPARRTGSLTALPAAGSAKLLLNAAYRDPTADWLTLAAYAVVYCEDGDVEDDLVAADGAVRVAASVRKHDLYIVESAPDALFKKGGHAIVHVVEGKAPPPGARSWVSLRHQSLR